MYLVSMLRLTQYYEFYARVNYCKDSLYPYMHDIIVDFSNHSIVRIMEEELH